MIPRCTLAAVFVLVLLTADNTKAQFFTDEFDDGSIDDGMPVSWNDGGLGGVHDVSSGDLVLTPVENNIVILVVDGFTYGDVTTRTQLMVSGPGYREAGIFARGVEGEGLYRAGISGDQLDGTGPTELFILKFEVGGNTVTVLDSTPANLDPTQTDIILEFDVAGETLNLTAWAENGTRPLVPQLSVHDAQFSEGVIGPYIISDGPTPTDATFRRFAVIPEPSTSLLLIMGILAATRTRRRLLE
jgi:hypothetical protein